MSNLLLLSGQLNRSSIFYKCFICQDDQFLYFPDKNTSKVNADKLMTINIQQRVPDLDIDFQLTDKDLQMFHIFMPDELNNQDINKIFEDETFKNELKEKF